MAGSLVSLMWSIVVIAMCMSVQIPNSSSFPEVDFASKCMGAVTDNFQASSSLCELLSPLSNANSKDVKKRVRGTRIFVGASMRDASGVSHIEVTTDSSLGSLKKNELYS
jgi:hypothetical protein